MIGVLAGRRLRRGETTPHDMEPEPGWELPAAAAR
jgi:hypothetical protein